MHTIRLCAICAAHAQAIEYHAADALVAATTSHIPHPFPAGGGDRFVKQAMADWQAGRSRVFCILVDHLEAGVVSLEAIDHQRSAAEIGIWIARPYWGRGIGTRALHQVVAYGGEHLGLDALWSACLADNHGSKRIHEKNGFALRGRFVADGAFGTRLRGRTMLRFHRPLTTAGRDQEDPRGIELAECAA